MKRLTKEQKINEVEQQLNRLFDDLKRKAFADAQSAIASGSVPDYMFEQDSYLLVMSVMDDEAWKRINDPGIRQDMRNIRRCV